MPSKRTLIPRTFRIFGCGGRRLQALFALFCVRFAASEVKMEVRLSLHPLMGIVFMASHRRKGRPCKFESLEKRNLLAGDVTASIRNGDLVIKGDDLDNGITITAGATAGSVLVTGVNAGGTATNVNGT